LLEVRVDTRCVHRFKGLAIVVRKSEPTQGCRFPQQRNYVALKQRACLSLRNLLGQYKLSAKEGNLRIRGEQGKVIKLTFKA